MASRQKERPFIELGALLEKWRSEKHRSALALFKEAKFSFSYSAYADFERGVTLPSIEALVELTKAFHKDARDAALVWARVQMPSDELREVFSHRAPEAPVSPVGKPDEMTPSFENTWVFGPRERDMLLKAPWLWDLCVAMSLVFPNETPFDQIRLPKGVTQKALLEKHFRFAIEAGFVIPSRTGLRLRHPHNHVPKTWEWEEVRKNNVRNGMEGLLEGATAELLEKNLANRFMIVRPLSETQLKKWVMESKKLEYGFKEDTYVEGEHPNYGMLLVLAKRPTKA